jgi:predicted polyphosphate/ATP-dependent NAD kinase
LHKVIFLVNPMSGIGGPLGLKGSDSLPLQDLGVIIGPVYKRALLFFSKIKREPVENVRFLVPEGYMGSFVLNENNYRNYETICTPTYPSQTSDTKNCIINGLREDPDIVIVAGGDGTLYDVAKVVGDHLPILGIPAGTKMYSSVFASSIESASQLFLAYLSGNTFLTIGEVILVDEKRIRSDYGLHVIDRVLVKTIESKEGELHQYSKDISSGGWSEEELEGIAEYVVNNIIKEDDVVILGPGSTVQKIAEKMGVKKPLLSISIIRGGKTVCIDCDSITVYDITSKTSPEKIKIVLSPLAKSGFLLGRGNQKITLSVLKKLSKKNLIVVSTKEKLRGIRKLYADLGDPNLAEKYSGYMRVITGYQEETVVPLYVF